ncbi:MAG: hypothetical protein IJL98_06450 [Lachnospiraceae bacterium]|nr:hypothetical protein [Lachnospiraceae bacterium]
MKHDRIRNCFEQMKPGEKEKEKMLEMILERKKEMQEKNETQAGNSFLNRPAAGKTAAVIGLALLIVLFIILDPLRIRKPQEEPGNSMPSSEKTDERSETKKAEEQSGTEKTEERSETERTEERSVTEETEEQSETERTEEQSETEKTEGPSKSEEQGKTDSSEENRESLFSQEDIEEALSAAKASFSEHFPGWELRDMRYCGDEQNRRLTETGQWNHYHMDEIMVLYSDFYTGSGGDDSVAKDSLYTDFMWILGRKSGGAWKVLSWGY